MASKWLYVCGVCQKSMKPTAPSIACTSFFHWIHLKQCAKLSFKEALEKKKSFVCSVCIKEEVVSDYLKFLNFETKIRTDK